MDYRVVPGLYAVGLPDDQSPVLVSANYKMSFDHLREASHERSFWILVLDTDGVNVWCAAGKGTFGTAELVCRIALSGLEKVVSHRNLILPQLAAPGVAAHLVKKLSGFKVQYGPIRATDIPDYFNGGGKATPQMRTKSFTLWERMVVIPVELVEALKAAVILMLVFFFLSGLGSGTDGYWSAAVHRGGFAVVAILGAVLGGTVAVPILLPFLPGRAFSIKGISVGLAVVLLLFVYRSPHLLSFRDNMEFAAWVFMVFSLTNYLAMNFTGCTTFTSLSGVKKEMRVALPLQIGAVVTGLILWVGSLFAG
jgi:acetyl-CoA decarbonylase/synthase complex subunit gamma